MDVTTTSKTSHEVREEIRQIVMARLRDNGPMEVDHLREMMCRLGLEDAYSFTQFRKAVGGLFSKYHKIVIAKKKSDLSDPYESEVRLRIVLV